MFLSFFKTQDMVELVSKLLEDMQKCVWNLDLKNKYCSKTNSSIAIHAVTETIIYCNFD